MHSLPLKSYGLLGCYFDISSEMFALKSILSLHLLRIDFVCCLDNARSVFIAHREKKNDEFIICNFKAHILFSFIVFMLILFYFFLLLMLLFFRFSFFETLSRYDFIAVLVLTCSHRSLICSPHICRLFIFSFC